MSNREEVQQLAKEFIEKGQPLKWFEELYNKVEEGNFEIVPWADLAPNPNLVALLEKKIDNTYAGKKALVTGCGLGDDAEYLAQKGFVVDAFDIAPSAIKNCQKRFPQSQVNYFTADLLEFTPKEKYDFVVESYTLQVLPMELREKAIQNLASFFQTNGELIIICRGREEEEAVDSVPFPLTKTELSAFEQHLEKQCFEDYYEKNDSGKSVRRFRIQYKKS